MRQLLAGYAAAVAESVESPAAVVTDLEALSSALVHFGELRSALSDPGIPVATRRAVLRDLLEQRAQPASVDLLSFALRVERPSELATVVSQLAEALRPDSDDEGALVGRTAGRERLRGYAERILQELASSAKVDEVEDEIFRLARIFDGEPALRVTLSDPQIPLVARLEVLDELLAQKVRPATLRLARATLSSGQQRDLVGTLEWLASLAAEERGRRLAEVRSVVELNDAEWTRLATALTRLVERPVEVRVVADPSVVGGALVTVGDLIIDGTVRMRLERLRDAMAPSS